MWKSVSITVVGQPLTVRSNCAVAAVTLPDESFVVLSVNVPFPAHDASASVIAGTSFDVLRSAVKTNFVWGVGDGVGVGAGVLVGAVVGATAAVPPQAPIRTAVAARLARRRIDTSLLVPIDTAGGVSRMKDPSRS